jgi:hypothetical protein
MKNNDIKNTALITVILCIPLLNIFSQNTLNYVFKPDKESTRSWNVIQYFVEDSIFAIENLFFYGSQHPCYFKIENEQWFMKYDSDWKIFFNRKEEKCGDWNIEGIHLTISWRKTNVFDNTDTVYEFSLIPLPQMEDGMIVTIGIIDGTNLYYFTYSSGVIAYWDAWNVYIREDKMHLKDYLWKEKYSK